MGIKDIFFNIKMRWQKLVRGYSDLEIWNLDDTIRKWMLPRLRIFRKDTQAYPEIPGECESFEEWQAVLGEMIFGLEFDDQSWYTEHVLDKEGSEKEEVLEYYKRLSDRAQKGRELFGKYLYALWW